MKKPPARARPHRAKANSASAAAPLPWRVRRAALLVMVVALTIVASVLFWSFRNRQHIDNAIAAASIPLPQLHGAEPQVVNAMNEARINLERAQDSAEAWGRYGQVLDAHELHADAESCYQRANELESSDDRWLYLLALKRHMAGGDVDQVVPLYRRAAELEPQVPTALCRIGEVFAVHGRLQESIEAFRTVVKKFPAVAAAHRSLGHMLLQQGDVQAAMAALEHANQLVPNDKLVAIAMAQAHMRLNQRAEAERYEQHSRQCADRIRLPDPYLHEVRLLCVSTQRCHELADSVLAEGDYAAATRLLTIVVKSMPDDAHAHARLGRAYMGAGQADHARHHLNRALALDPTFQDAHTSMGMLLMGVNQPASAAEHFQRALSTAPENANLRGMYAASLAHQGRTSEALQQFHQAENSGPLDVLAELEWASMHDRAHHLAEAIVHYERVLKLDPAHLAARYRLGLVLERSGRAREAAEHFQQVLSIDPTHPAASRLSSQRFNSLQ